MKKASKSDAKRAATLKEELNRHMHAYHVLDSPLVSDAQFDSLFRELQSLCMPGTSVLPKNWSFR